MVDFFLRDGDAQKAQGAQHLDDIDLIHSARTIGPWGPVIVAVAMRAGTHVCWYCGCQFIENGGPKHQAEVKLGYTYVLLHTGCVDKKPRSSRSFEDLTRGLQARRFAAKAAKTIQTVVTKGKELVDAGRTIIGVDRDD